MFAWLLPPKRYEKSTPQGVGLQVTFPPSICKTITDLIDSLDGSIIQYVTVPAGSTLEEFVQATLQSTSMRACFFIFNDTSATLDTNSSWKRGLLFAQGVYNASSNRISIIYSGNSDTSNLWFGYITGSPSAGFTIQTAKQLI